MNTYSIGGICQEQRRVFPALCDRIRVAKCLELHTATSDQSLHEVVHLDTKDALVQRVAPVAEESVSQQSLICSGRHIGIEWKKSHGGSSGDSQSDTIDKQIDTG